jgi:hypothetical protein
MPASIDLEDKGSVATRSRPIPLDRLSVMPDTLSMSDEPGTNLELDLQVLSERLRSDDLFARDVYFALCNTDWKHEAGAKWHGSWRYSAGLVANLRGLGEDMYDFYCSRPGREGSISPQVAQAMGALGWHGTPHGRDFYAANLGPPDARGDTAASEQT